jgi:uncharacterized membrane protein (UPF0127 family)
MAAVSPRFNGLARREAAGVPVPVAGTFRTRLLGLALLKRANAGAGLLIPRCRCVHTFGMRFDLDLVFLDAEGREIRRDQAVPSCRVALEWGADAVVEFPSGSRDLALPGTSRASTAPIERTTTATGSAASTPSVNDCGEP